MLKTSINIFKICTVCLFVCASLSIILEFVSFSHSHFIQELSIGTACSLIVVVISTYVQYRIEFKRAYFDYISATSNLIFMLTLYLDYKDILDDKLAEKIFAELDMKFEEFNKAESTVLYITKRASKKQININKELNSLHLQFLKKQFVSQAEAVRAVTDYNSVICAIDTYLEEWPSCYQKKRIDEYKKWLTESGEEDNKSN